MAKMAQMGRTVATDIEVVMPPRKLSMKYRALRSPAMSMCSAPMAVTADAAVTAGRVATADAAATVAGAGVGWPVIAPLAMAATVAGAVRQAVVAMPVKVDVVATAAMAVMPGQSM